MPTKAKTAIFPGVWYRGIISTPSLDGPARRPYNIREGRRYHPMGYLFCLFILVVAFFVITMGGPPDHRK